MQQIFGQNGTPNVSYVVRPGEGGYSSLLTFSQQSAAQAIDRAFLCENATVDFRRNLSKLYFINHRGIAYVMGRGTGTLSLRGMLGHPEDFAYLFGEDATDPCQGLYTVQLDAFGLEACDWDDSGTLIMEGVAPVSFVITAETHRENGALWYTANATFEISGLKVHSSGDDRNTSN